MHHSHRWGLCVTFTRFFLHKLSEGCRLFYFCFSPLRGSSCSLRAVEAEAVPGEMSHKSVPKKTGFLIDGYLAAARDRKCSCLLLEGRSLLVCCSINTNLSQCMGFYIKRQVATPSTLLYRLACYYPERYGNAYFGGDACTRLTLPQLCVLEVARLTIRFFFWFCLVGGQELCMCMCVCVDTVYLCAAAFKIVTLL